MPYRAPADQDDFALSKKFSPAKLAKEWDDKMREWVGDQIKALPRSFRRFYDGVDDDSEPIGITWDAFPQVIHGYLGRTPAAYAAAEVLRPKVIGCDSDRNPVVVSTRQQDEYCEWFTHRVNDVVIRIDFTCEAPEYWEHLGQDIDLVFDLYREHVSEDVRKDDLVWAHDVFVNGEARWKKGSYNRWNIWNTERGAMHLTHTANTLQAEINLAALASILRTLDGGRTVVKTVHELSCCSPFGDINRSSDPNIGFGVNDLVRRGNMVALANPIGLYIADVNLNEIVDANGDPVAKLTVKRGSETVVNGKKIPRLLRVTVTVPTDREATVGGAAPLQFGGQIAEQIGMVLYGVGKPAPQGPPDPQDPEQKCCHHPDHPDISARTEDLSLNCASFPWEEFDRRAAPLTTEQSDEMLLAAAPLAQMSEPVKLGTRTS